jgi:hypothetical protein
VGRGSESLVSRARAELGSADSRERLSPHKSFNFLPTSLKRPRSAAAETRPFVSPNPMALLHDLDEDDEEREQDQGLDEGQSHEQGDLNSGTGRGITSQSFARR